MGEMHTASIRTYLFLLVMVVTVPLAAIVGWGIYSDMQQAIENTKTTLRTLNDMMVRNTGSNIAQARQTLESLADRPQIKQFDPDNCDPILQSLLKMNPRYANVGYTNRDGEVVCSAVPQPRGKLASLSRAVWFQKLMKDKRFTIGEPFLGPITGKQVSVLGMPVWNEQHEMIGSVQLPLGLNFYDPDIPIRFMSKNIHYGFFDGTGVLIWCNTDAEHLIGTKPDSGYAKKVMATRDGGFEAVGPDGSKRYYSVATMPDINWIAFVSVPASEIYAAAEHRAVTNTGITFAVIVALLLMANIIARRIRQPVMALEKVAVAIHEGNHNVRAVDAGLWEAASVARAINIMIDAQQKSTETLNAAQSIAHLGSFEWNIKTEELQWSDEHFRLWGMEPQSVAPSNALFREAIHPEDVSKVEEAIGQALRKEREYSSEFRVLWPDGSEHVIASRGDILFDVSGQALRMLGTVQDITVRKLAENKLHESEQRFRYMLDTCPTAARIARKGGHEVVFFNPRYAALIGLEGNQVSGRDPASYYVNRGDYDDIVARLGRGEQVLEKLVELNIPGAGVKWTLASYLQILYQGEPAVLGWFHDISEAMRVERMKSEFVSTVSHELRTPLTAISGALGLVAGGVLGEMPEQVKQLIDIAHKNSMRLTSLINDLLDIDKLVAGQVRLDMVEQPLMPLVEQALEAIRAYGDIYEVSFKLIAREDLAVQVDAERLIQVLNNFLSNAAKFSPKGGQVEIAVRRMKEVVRVEVIDHGAGIPSEFRNRIFQRFSQADSSDTRQKGGTGLGLAISKELIERMNGLAGFDSQPGQGSCFYFELPCAR